MRLKHIEISGFRGFPKTVAFDLSADATILVGANGLGKTSLLDAIHWGLCGQLPRLGENGSVISLYSETGQARTTLRLTQPNGEELCIIRLIDSDSHSVSVVENGQQLKGSIAKARLIESLWPDAASANDENSVLSSTLTRCVYLQQDRIRDFVESTTDRDRFSVISELVGTGRLNELQSQLESESRSWAIATGKLAKESDPLSKRVQDLESQLLRLRETVDSKTDGELPEWQVWWKRVGTVVDVPNVPAPSSPDAATRVSDAIQRLESSRAKQRRLEGSAVQLRELAGSKPEFNSEAIPEAQVLLDQAGKELADVRQEIKSAQERTASLRAERVRAKELVEQHKALAEIAIRLLEERCPVCQQDYDVDATRARLEELIGEKGPSEPVAAENSIEKLLEREKQSTEKVSKCEAKLRDVKAQGAKHEQWKVDVSSLCQELGVDPSKIEEEIEPVLEKLKVKEQLAVQCVRDGELMAANLARESAKARLLVVEAELEKSRQELLQNSRRIEIRERAYSTARRIIEELREANSKIAVERLRDIEPFLQRIYARIDPHPAFRAISFVTSLSRGKGRLNAVIKDEEAVVSSEKPSSVLSSSQLNALAVSLFLSFNLTLPSIPVQAAVLDDPIQSLDEINLLGLVDLLRRTKDERQLLVSTHDSRFGELLARKLRPASPGKRTSVIELRGWSRSGPDIEQYEVEADVSPRRLVGAE
ncbi:AAA family ATPase [Bremerella sp. T1]|uniref:AAA family ATPase n=1 Tax=Bremerella sp. TYQ1 TaxID=3119568 RepID=UPI001CCB8C55|nr:AAA family ATPase [Bremerella volcania]UBM33742.1 AAA family ATPase [Bremerella volcania]